MAAKQRKRPDGGHGSIPALVARQLCKRYRAMEAPALEDFSVVVGQGECYGLLGPNGAGKTTAMSILSGLMSFDTGTLSILGRLPGKDARAIRSLVGIVPQELALYEQLSARRNLAFFGRLYGLNGLLLQRRVDECLAFVDLAGRDRCPVSEYSGGMKRRLNLAAGMVGNPAILFLDEPTVGIDIQSRHLIYRRLIELKARGVTIFYTTHYLKEAEQLCDRVGIIDCGRLAIEGSPGELVTRCGAVDLDGLLLRLSGDRPRD